MAAVERIDLGVRVAGEKAKESDEFITLSQLVNGTNITTASNGDILIDIQLEDIPSVVSDKNFIHNQLAPMTVWTINHPLNKKPSITILDSAGTQVHGKVDYISDTQLIVNFQYAFAGTAYLN